MPLQPIGPILSLPLCQISLQPPSAFDQSAMAPPTDVKRVRPKRKRQEICYNESSPTPSDDESQIKAAPPKKVQPTNPFYQLTYAKANNSRLETQTPP